MHKSYYPPLGSKLSLKSFNKHPGTMFRPFLSFSVCSLLSFFLLALIAACTPAPVLQPEWPEITQTAKPWTRWWWQGSSVNKEDLTAEMEAYQQAGLGGVEITPIYGVVGYEEQFIDYLSPAWMEMLEHTFQEGERLGVGIDMATGTGWPFGGPWIDAEDACKNVVYKTYTLQSGESLREPIRYQQEPLLRAVGNQVYQTYGIYKVPGATTQGSPQQPLLKPGSSKLEISQLVEPVAANENLQALALDQVRFAKPLPLLALMAYAENGETLELTERVNENGQLDWVAPEGSWTLYAVFQGWHGKMVERAAPGGEGNVIDHFSETALRHYLQRFDSAFSGHDITSLRAFFNDSYEVDDASGQANWTPELLEAFETRRGYDLREHLPALFGQDTEDKNQRVLCDYRETVAELLLEKFTRPWQAWAQGKDAIIRNQSHGSPTNILDLYAASDIPETEGTEILRAKFASSAANVSGKPLISSESATWLNEHFLSNLADIRKNIERYFLGGVNHVFYHGTAYSPQTETWPGWLFYAAVHVNPRNPLWKHFPALNHYITRIQAFLQSSKPNNDILLYCPAYDAYSTPGNEMLQHFDGMEAFEGSDFEESAQMLQERGYAFDFISDAQLQGVTAKEHSLETGGIEYQTVIVPETQFIPLNTFEKLVNLGQNGATIIVHKNLPADVPGLGDLENRRTAFQELTAQLDFSETEDAGIRRASLSNGTFLMGDDLEAMLAYAQIRRESMVDQGLQYIRKTHDTGHTYFIVNWSENAFEGWVPLSTPSLSAAIFDPMHDEMGVAAIRSAEEGILEAYVQLAPGTSCILQTYEAALNGPAYPYMQTTGTPWELQDTWNIRFTEGGPELPSDTTIATLSSWTTFGEAAKNFSGTATYTLSFAKPAGESNGWLLNLGEVHETASVQLNGTPLDTLIGPDYRVFIAPELIQEENRLEIEVANLMANRIAYLDRAECRPQEVFWKKFYNVNFPARLGENRNEYGLFTAKHWEPRESGLMGPVTLTPVEDLDL